MPWATRPVTPGSSGSSGEATSMPVSPAADARARRASQSGRGSPSQTGAGRWVSRKAVRRDRSSLSSG